jgi:MFS family permease
MIGSMMQDTALPWLVLQLTASPRQVGLLIFCRYTPFLLFGLFSGTLADRFDNRRLLIWSQAGQLAVASALALLAFATKEPWPFFILAALGGLGTILDGPSRQAFTFRVVGREDIPNAVALNSSVNNTGLVVGPAIGGVLIAVVGVGWCFTVNAASFLVLLITLLLIRTRELFPIDNRHVHVGTFVAITEGLRYASRSREIRLALGIVALTSLAGFNFRVILPVLAERTLDSGSTTFGILFAAFGLGSMTGGLTVASIARASWGNLVLGAVTFDLALLLLAPLHTVVAAAAVLFIVGLSFTFWMSNTQSILQLEAPDRLRGRIISLFFFAWAGVAPLSALVAGWLCNLGGTELALTVAGIGGLTTIGVASVLGRGFSVDSPRVPRGG